MTDKPRTRYTLRALACLKAYWPLVVGAYAVTFLINGANIWMPMIIGDIVDTGIRAGVRENIRGGVVLLMGVAVAKGVFTYLSGIWSENASQGVAYDLRNRFHEKLQALSFSFHDESETGQLLARSVQDVDRIRFLTGRAVLHLVQMATQILGVSVAMFVINHQLALMTFTIMPFLVLGSIRFGSRFRPLSMKIRDREANLTSRLEQNLRGARIVKAFAREDHEIDLFDQANRSLLRVQRTEAKLRALFMPFMQLLAAVGTLIVLVWGGRLVIDEVVTIGALVAFMTYLTQLLIPIRRFGWILSAVAQASASAERIFEVLDLDSEITDAPDAVDLDEVDGRITFDHVGFSYARSRRVLDDVSFIVEPGEKLALLGGTGSGKSSIINLIPRFYDPTEGIIRVDETDVRSVTLKSLRDRIGIVLQDTVLFVSTIRENIAFGKPGASQDEVEQAARAARIHDFIVSLPAGYDTRVGEKGVTLSGGQKQRLSIARAILKNPKILILDDATSSVDTETEQQIQAALETLMTGRTSIIIAQRLSTIRSADQVLVLERGRIAARARRTESETPHEQLLRTSGLYSEIFERQLRRRAPEPGGNGGDPSGTVGEEAHR
ncbi:MAG: ABC transporter ATP-binding protein [Spirochaetota bacterium]